MPTVYYVEFDGGFFRPSLKRPYKTKPEADRVSKTIAVSVVIPVLKTKIDLTKSTQHAD